MVFVSSYTAERTDGGVSARFSSSTLTEHSVFRIEDLFGQEKEKLFPNATGIETFFVLEEDLQRLLEVLFFVFVQLECKSILYLSLTHNSYLIDGVLHDTVSTDMDDEQRIDRVHASTHHRLKVMHESIADRLVHFQLPVVLKQHYGDGE